VAVTLSGAPVNAFGLGYGTALAAGFAVWAGIQRARQPDPLDVAGGAPLFLLASGSILVFGWVLVWGPLSQIRNPDVRAAFRAADPRGWKSAATGLLSGLAAIASVVLAYRLNEPSGQERDLATVRFGLIAFMLIAFSWMVGAALFLAVFRPRQAPPAPPEAGP
jgi:hypothetical protein